MARLGRSTTAVVDSGADDVRVSWGHEVPKKWLRHGQLSGRQIEPVKPSSRQKLTRQSHSNSPRHAKVSVSVSISTSKPDQATNHQKKKKEKSSASQSLITHHKTTKYSSPFLPGQYAAQPPQHLHQGHLARPRPLPLQPLPLLQPPRREAQHHICLPARHEDALLELVHIVCQLVDLELQQRLDGVDAGFHLRADRLEGDEFIGEVASDLAFFGFEEREIGELDGRRVVFVDGRHVGRWWVADSLPGLFFLL